MLYQSSRTFCRTLSWRAFRTWTPSGRSTRRWHLNSRESERRRGDERVVYVEHDRIHTEIDLAIRYVVDPRDFKLFHHNVIKDNYYSDSKYDRWHRIADCQGHQRPRRHVHREVLGKTHQQHIPFLHREEHRVEEWHNGAPVKNKGLWEAIDEARGKQAHGCSHSPRPNDFAVRHGESVELRM